MKKISTLIVDDEPLARANIVQLLRREAGLELIGEASSGRRALKAIRELRPELVFLDVQMPDLTGVEVLGRLSAAERPAVVFVTAYDAFAIRAFDFHAIDYLLKPYTDERFHEAVMRIRTKLRVTDLRDLNQQVEALIDAYEARDAEPASALPSAAQIVVKSGNDYHVFHPEEIMWVEGQGDYLKIHGKGGTALVRETMLRFLSRVPAQMFVRVHKSTIVNLAFVRKLEPIYSGDYRLVMQDGTELRMSRYYRTELLPLLN